MAVGDTSSMLSTTCPETSPTSIPSSTASSTSTTTTDHMAHLAGSLPHSTFQSSKLRKPHRLKGAEPGQQLDVCFRSSIEFPVKKKFGRFLCTRRRWPHPVWPSRRVCYWRL